jgi:NAD(P)-dependent dehydrogenase (short-subunit alcohol dehydrogenase family)
MSNNLENQKVVIAGGSSGIGLSTAKLLHAQKAKVTITGRDENKLQKVKQDFPSMNTFSLDSGNEKALKEFFEKNEIFHHLVIAVSGAKGAGPFSSLSVADLREGFEAKFWAHVKTIQAALPYLQKDGSITIVTASSTSSRLPGTSGLAAINGALEMMIPILAKEFQPLRINAVSPGVIDTTWWNFLKEEDKKTTFEQFSKQVCVGRIGRPDEVANAILSMITNDYINGTILLCNGGLL